MRILSGPPFEEILPAPSGRVLLECWTDYVAEGGRDEPNPLPKSCVKRVLPGDAGWRVLINFGDYIGLLKFGDQTAEICSEKLDSKGFDDLLKQITDRVSNLPFDVDAPAFVPFSRDALNDQDRIYHALIYLRWAMRFRSPTLRESWGQIAADPHRTLVREERTRAPWEVRDLTPRSLERIAAHPETWARLSADSPMQSTALAHALSDSSGKHYFPTQIVEVVAETCINTPENRFAKHFLGTARDLLKRAGDLLESRDGAESRLVQDARALSREVHAMEATPFLRDVGEMRRFPVHSQVLQRRTEYRELLLHHQALVMASSYPISAADLTRIIETKSASLLYEYWCFFELAEQMGLILGAPTRGIVASGDDLHATIAEGMRLEFPGGAELHYNRSFSHSSSQWRSYSVSLRPDIVLKFGDKLHLFDAKFRIDRWDVPTVESDIELESTEADDRAGVASKSWWKNADIHKMHAYKDALQSNGSRAATVWVLYPGSEFVFYGDDSVKLGAVSALRSNAIGVGAIPMHPSTGSIGRLCGEVLSTLLGGVEI